MIGKIKINDVPPITNFIAGFTVLEVKEFGVLLLEF